ncbi:MAG: transcriptional regulator [Deltaproteobacteria bacterium RIFCSPLOWO2_02_FULL_46_8]|nr:MAG: transcriptional regulator [Deltaproteobacteria bacterium RIFCSPLOWO2_02_FULL_46_8]
MSLKLGNIIREHRKNAGLTQIQLANIAGVGKTVVFDVENGKESIRFSTLTKILDVLNIQINFKSPLLGEPK